MDDKIIETTKNGTIIIPYVKDTCKTLVRETSIWDKVYHKAIEITGFILPYKDTKAFVTHNQSRKYLKSSFYDYQINELPTNKARYMEEFKFNSDIVLTEVQREILTEITDNPNRDEIFIHLQTGYGKTILAIYVSAIIGYKTLITCFSSNILRQWVNTLVEKTNCHADRICLLNSTKTLMDIYTDNYYYEDKDIFLCTPGLLTGFGSRYGYEKLYPLINRMGIGTLIVDEAHRNIANIVKINAFTNIDKTLYLSADNTVGDSEKERMYKNIFNNTLFIKPSDGYNVSMRYTKAIVYEYNSHPSQKEKDSIFTDYGYSSRLFVEYQFGKEYLLHNLDLILESIYKSNVEGYRILILLNFIDHVNMVYQKLKDDVGSLYVIGRFHSQMEQDEKDSTLEHADIIVSTYQSFGTGMDVVSPPIKYVISTNNENKVSHSQAAGRARPLPDKSDVYYFIMIDVGFANYTKKKLGKVLNYLQENKLKEVIKIKSKE
jgi:superfamily II DNA or RNA helicase